MNKYALLVIDVQNYFFDKNSQAYLPDSVKIIPKINNLIKFARDKKWSVIYTSHTAPSRPGNLMAERWEHLPSGW
ncbi:MAG: isochorismatase family protein, partial [Candidatus Edwardsbacteria bacterium]|nr:isochorismatase family protein [Candidatus Edwardsbacteria bacterium]MBU1577222.1 isochorismatase family protein [Candidatus Edwardsbacteria bacterium]MBU2462570.1 isochorismatase family protein [Candidatus Edwardsbacteria bacterium]